jgi:hemoglobin-like flavoprotein
MALDTDLLRNSFELVTEKEPELTHRFYDHLFERYPDVRPMFSRRSRDRQEQMLQDALVAVVDHLDDAPWLEGTLTALGAKHVEYGVTPEMYDWVGECLLLTLAEVAGEAWNDALHKAWSDAYGAIAGLMIQGAEDVEGTPMERAVRATTDGARG